MGTLWIHTVCVLLALISSPNAQQLLPSENRILLQLQQLLEYPQPLQSWNNWTNFCFLPPTDSLTIICSGSHVTELTIVGNKSSPSSKSPKPTSSNFKPLPHLSLSPSFSLDSFFTVLTKLTNLQKLSLVSLGLWGPLPAKVDRLRSLRALNLSSNFIYGEIPQSLSTYPSLQGLALGDNMLNGSVPDLSGLISLQEIDLSSNELGPEFPSLGGRNLVRINLKSNKLRSEIPRSLENLYRARAIDLSSNELVGPIPSFLFSLPSIAYVSLADNRLSGGLPSNVSCGKNLSFVDVSSNLLIGRLPKCLTAAPYLGNKTVVIMFNCFSNTSSKYQRPRSYCEKDALAVEPPARNQQKTLKLGIVLAVIGSVVAILAVLGLLILVIFRRIQRRRSTPYRCESFVLEKNPIHGSPLGRHVPQPMRMTSLGLPPYNVFALEEIEDATNSFDSANLVAEGSQGQVYKGCLRDGSVVLVKCLKAKQQKHSSQALQHHMEVISKLRHRHLVSVLGHCVVTYQDHPNTPSTAFIVLETISNGSLKDHLTDWKRREVLKWPQRMGIAMGVARGIQYLHTAGIYGNELKLESILLDESLTAKISSYNIGLPSSKVGSESPLNGQDSTAQSSGNPEKEDIYRLGVILIEVITGRPVSSQTEADDVRFQLERSLAESPSKLRDLTDPTMRGTFAFDSLKTAVQIAVNCLSRDAGARPTVEDVLWHMQYSVQVQEGWASSGNLSGNLTGNLGNRF